MKLSFVYIIECSDNSYYTGVTNNVHRRFIEHQDGIDPNSYTFNRRPLKLVYYAEFTNIELAIKKEKQIKGWSRAKKKALVEGRYETLPNLAKKNFEK